MPTVVGALQNGQFVAIALERAEQREIRQLREENAQLKRELEELRRRQPQPIELAGVPREVQRPDRVAPAVAAAPVVARPPPVVAAQPAVEPDRDVEGIKLRFAMMELD